MFKEYKKKRVIFGSNRWDDYKCIQIFPMKGVQLPRRCGTYVYTKLIPPHWAIIFSLKLSFDWLALRGGTVQKSALMFSCIQKSPWAVNVQLESRIFTV